MSYNFEDVHSTDLLGVSNYQKMYGVPASVRACIRACVRAYVRAYVRACGATKLRSCKTTSETSVFALDMHERQLFSQYLYSTFMYFGGDSRCKIGLR